MELQSQEELSLGPPGPLADGHRGLSGVNSAGPGKRRNVFQQLSLCQTSEMNLPSSQDIAESQRLEGVPGSPPLCSVLNRAKSAPVPGGRACQPPCTPGLQGQAGWLPCPQVCVADGRHTPAWFICCSGDTKARRLPLTNSNAAKN